MKKTLTRDYEILVVNDGSIDSTLNIVKKIRGIRVLSHKKNKGKAEALKTGFKNSRGNILITIDADCTYPPESIPDLVKEMNKYDMVVGSRFMKGFVKGFSWHRNLANIAGARVISILFGEKITDVTSGLRAFKKELTNLPITAKGLEFEVEFTTRVIKKGYKYGEVAIPFEERAGRSKLKFVRDCFKFLFKALEVKFKTS